MCNSPSTFVESSILFLVSLSISLCVFVPPALGSIDTRVTGMELRVDVLAYGDAISVESLCV